MPKIRLFRLLTELFLAVVDETLDVLAMSENNQPAAEHAQNCVYDKCGVVVDEEIKAEHNREKHRRANAAPERNVACYPDNNGENSD